MSTKTPQAIAVEFINGPNVGEERMVWTTVPYFTVYVVDSQAFAQSNVDAEIPYKEVVYNIQRVAEKHFAYSVEYPLPSSDYGIHLGETPEVINVANRKLISVDEFVQADQLTTGKHVDEIFQYMQRELSEQLPAFAAIVLQTEMWTRHVEFEHESQLYRLTLSFAALGFPRKTS